MAWAARSRSRSATAAAAAENRADLGVAVGLGDVRCRGGGLRRSGVGPGRMTGAYATPATTGTPVQNGSVPGSSSGGRGDAGADDVVM